MSWCTMNKFLLAVVVSCVASQLAMGQCLFGFGKKKCSILAVDFDGVEKHLQRKVVDDYDPEPNIARLRKDMKKFSGGVKRAAEIMLELADARQCNDKLLVALHDSASYTINNDFRVRVWKVIRDHLSRAVGVCKAYIDEQVPRRYEAADEALKQFTRHVGPYFVDSSKGPMGAASPVPSDDVPDTPDDYELLYNNKFAVPDYSYQDWKATIDASKLNFFMLQWAKSAGDTNVDKQNFESAFQKYLLKPCEQFEATFGTLLEGFRALSFFKGSDGVEFVQERSAQLRRLAYTYKVCLAVQIVDHNDDGKQGLNYNKQDMQRGLPSN